MIFGLESRDCKMRELTQLRNSLSTGKTKFLNWFTLDRKLFGNFEKIEKFRIY